MSNEAVIYPVVVTTNAPVREEAEILSAIFARIAEGGAASVACDDEGMNRRTFWRRLASDPETLKTYEAAIATRGHVYAEEIVVLADEPPPLVGDTNHKAGGERMDSAAVAWAKNRIDARKWVISKLLPKKYGEKIETEHSGGVKLEVSWKKPPPEPEEVS